MKMRYPNTGLEVFCRLVGKSRQAYYLHQHAYTKREREQRLVIEMVLFIREELPMLGSKKLLYLLSPSFEASNIKIGRDKFLNLLRDNGLLIRRRKRSILTTKSNNEIIPFVNLAKDLNISGINQLWVSDITYIPVGSSFSFLSLITDAYSRKIVGFCLHPTLHTDGCIIALKMALSTSSTNIDGLIHHSDRGIQYCSNLYTNLLKSNKIKISMSDRASPQQNAIAERVNGILKQEFGMSKTYNSHQSALESAQNAVKKYNEIRPHASCDYLTPAEAHLTTSKFKKRWKDYTKKKFGVKQFQG
jgi:putative transposase